MRLAPFAVNRTKRLIKSPKLYWSDPALALWLNGGGQPSGAYLENVVLLDLLVWRDGQVPAPEILFWRTSTDREVDFVIESGDRLLPIEVKSAAVPHPRRRARPADLRGRVSGTVWRRPVAPRRPPDPMACRPYSGRTLVACPVTRKPAASAGDAATGRLGRALVRALMTGGFETWVNWLPWSVLKISGRPPVPAAQLPTRVSRRHAGPLPETGLPAHGSGNPDPVLRRCVAVRGLPPRRLQTEVE